MKKLVKTLASNNSKRFLLLSFLLLLFGGTFCTNSLDNEGSQSSTGGGQIVVNLKPNSLFGNGSDLSEVQVVTGEIPDGSNVEFELTGSNLPEILEGCLLDKGTTIVNGQVSAKYLAGIVITSGSATPAPSTVNVAVTITGTDGKPENRFGTIILNSVSIIPPADFELGVPQADSTSKVGSTLKFLTVGIPPGTIVNFALSNPALGSLAPTSTAVLGSEGSGSATTSYTAVNGEVGTQVITATITLPNPFDIDNSCPVVPVEDRQAQAVVVITQSIATPAPATPTPTPTPTSTSAAMKFPSEGSDNGFTIAGGMVQFGQALASVLIPLIPVFAIVLRVQQRKRKKYEKN